MTRTRYGWMALGGLLVLFGIVLACKLRDGSQAHAQGDLPSPVVPEPKVDKTKTTEPPLAPVAEAPKVLPSIGKAAPSLDSPPPLLPAGLGDGKSSKVEPVEAKPILIPAAGTLPGSLPVPEVTPVRADLPAPPPPPIGVISPPMGSTAEPDTKPPPPAPSPKAAADVSPGGKTERIHGRIEADLLPKVGTDASPPAPPVSGKVVPPPAPGFPPPNLPHSVPTAKPDEVKVSLPAPVVEVKDPVGEPPLAPSPGPVVLYRVVSSGETFKSLSRKTLGTVERRGDIHKLNPALKVDAPLAVGATVRLPGDACVLEEETVKPLPLLRVRSGIKPKAILPLTGTYPMTLDDKKALTLPKAILKQLGSCDTVLVSPGSDKCLWLTNQAHLDRLAHKLEKSPARESDKSGFKRLYYAQTVKVPMKEGRVAIADKLAAFAGLDQEVVLVGIDDHFEVWDAARWRRYTQAKKASTMED